MNHIQLYGPCDLEIDCLALHIQSKVLDYLVYLNLIQFYILEW